MESVLRSHERAVMVGPKRATDPVDLSIYLDPSATVETFRAVVAFLETSGREVSEESLARHFVGIRTTPATIAALFGVHLNEFDRPDLGVFHAPDREPELPPELSSVTAILGLDSAPQARPRFRPASQSGLSYLPTQVAAAYDFPTASAAGHRVALIELGGGYREADIAIYFQSAALPVPKVSTVSVDGGTNSPTNPSSADTEVMLDIEVVGSVAPGVEIDVFFAPNTDRGFIDAVSQASSPDGLNPDAISISWGEPEATWSANSLNLMQSIIAEATRHGITVAVAAGDNGSSDGLDDGLAHVDFPASAPNALACGGTHLAIAPNGTIGSQTVWNDLAVGEGATGGGVSSYFELPMYQEGVGVPPSKNPGGKVGRGLPDVAGNADPLTGYRVLVDGSSIVVGGTSAVAPLMAGLVVQLAIASHGRPGFVQPRWYPLADATRASQTPAFFNVVSGNNGAYTAHAGWNACSGLGSPYGDRLLSKSTVTFRE